MSAVRTPIGSMAGSLAAVSGPKLGAAAIKAAVARAGVKPEDVGEVIMGNVVSSGVGQAPARQATLGAGALRTSPCVDWPPLLGWPQLCSLAPAA